jgi:hypothetical protein
MTKTTRNTVEKSVWFYSQLEILLDIDIIEINSVLYYIPD